MGLSIIRAGTEVLRHSARSLSLGNQRCGLGHTVFQLNPPKSVRDQGKSSHLWNKTHGLRKAECYEDPAEEWIGKGRCAETINL